MQLSSQINLHDFALVIINSSGGKDSVCAIYEIVRLAKEQNYSLTQIKVSHQDLGNVEWEGTKDLAKEQATFFGLDIHFSKRRDKNKKEEPFLDYVERRGKWPSSKQRWCTSDYKRGPGARIVTELTQFLCGCSSNILYVFGFRAQESPSRKKKENFKINTSLSTKKRKVYEYFPIQNWDTKKVWDTIKNNQLPYHYAYDLGMPRLSCVFCIFSPLDALVIAGKENPHLLDQYINVEEKIGHTFRKNFSLKAVKQKIQEGYTPSEIENWVM